jgi:hypothetical protein
MNRPALRRPLLASAVLAVTAALAVALLPAGPSAATPAPGADREAVNHLRSITHQYHNVDRAIADGYQPDTQCVEDMGIHYINFALMGQPVDPNRPTVLMYAPTANGGVRLTGVEWIKIDADQDLTTSGDRPSVYGHAFDGPMPGHFPGMPIHYDLHAYVWDANPDGPFATWNEHVDC